MSKRNGEQRATAAEMLAILKRQQYRCALSGRQLSPETAQIDHIVPISKGGSHDLSNIWIVENTINFAKGTMTVEEFVAVCRDVAQFEGQQAQTPAESPHGEEIAAATGSGWPERRPDCDEVPKGI